MRITKRQLMKLINEAQLTEADETGGATTSTLKKGLALAFPDWSEDIEGMDLKSSFVDEFAAMIGNAMKAAESGDLVKAATQSNKMAAARESVLRKTARKAARLLKEQGDPIADHLLGDFLVDVAQELTDSYDPQDAHRLGSDDEFQEQIVMITTEVEDLLRKRLSDLWSGDLRLELIG